MAMQPPPAAAPPPASPAAPAQTVPAHVAPTGPEPPGHEGDVAIDFPTASATLTVDALEHVKIIAASHGDRGIAIVGYGEAGASDPLVQAGALALAFFRAQALANAFVAQGVPSREVRFAAEAAGRGASVRLLQ